MIRLALVYTYCYTYSSRLQQYHDDSTGVRSRYRVNTSNVYIRVTQEKPRREDRHYIWSFEFLALSARHDGTYILYTLAFSERRARQPSVSRAKDW